MSTRKHKVMTERDRAEAMRLYRDPNWSAADIARKFGVTKNTIIGMAYRERVPSEQRKLTPAAEAAKEAAQARRSELRSRRNRARLLRAAPEFLSLPRDAQIATLHREGLAMREIGALYGVSGSRIGQIILAIRGAEYAP